ncbi:hypothetical protein [Actinomadura sp. WAC 06369]|uniref:hypothetical protein n=1 Tax=Actinomadura sp. WAC 06369 TaxID=2203193 RepID=UPI000F7760FF|nr:hypothetical protein [Actinomadura sp. WAC 06369]
MNSSRAQSFFAGMLVANSAPHIATAVSGRRHMTPLAGRESGPVANGVWAGLNLAGGAVLLRFARKGKEGARWDRDLVAFETGYLAFASWMALSERFFPMNSE